MIFSFSNEINDKKTPKLKRKIQHKTHTTKKKENTRRDNRSITRYDSRPSNVTRLVTTLRQRHGSFSSWEEFTFSHVPCRGDVRMPWSGPKDNLECPRGFVPFLGGNTSSESAPQPSSFTGRATPFRQRNGEWILIIPSAVERTERCSVTLSGKLKCSSVPGLASCCLQDTATTKLNAHLAQWG